MSKLYTIREVFLTLQGEGFHAGSRAVFVRTVGCNVWSGHEEHRWRDVVKGACAVWCDTEFAEPAPERGGGKLSAEEVVYRIVELWGGHKVRPLVVLTGGEPTLTIDQALVDALHDAGARVHLETNGSKPAPKVDWVTLSPKPPMPVLAQHYDEVKVVVPAFDPLQFGHHAEHRFVQPLDMAGVRAEASAVDFVLRHPEWRLSMQTHKLLRLP